jgi:hypothetical protein
VPDREDERDKRRFHLEEQREEHCMHLQMQQQFMKAMIMMMVGGNMFSAPTMNIPPHIPPIAKREY